MPNVLVDVEDWLAQTVDLKKVYNQRVKRKHIECLDFQVEPVKERIIGLLACLKIRLPISQEEVVSRLGLGDFRPEVDYVLKELELCDCITLKDENVVARNIESLDRRLVRYSLERYPKEAKTYDCAKSSMMCEGGRADCYLTQEDENKAWREYPQELLKVKSCKETKKGEMDEEIINILQYNTFKKRLKGYSFFSHSNNVIREYCKYRTVEECFNANYGTENLPCHKVHFKRLIQKNTDVVLGDCSFLNACFHTSVCKYVHYEVDSSYLDYSPTKTYDVKLPKLDIGKSPIVLFPPQWVKCDLRYLDITVLGKFDVIMADPAWDIHMELPYGTLADDEMMKLPIMDIQDEGFIFLWVTGRAMELGRECLSCWGYKRCDELVWIKTNQLQRLIRTGRTGHWLNHGKEHCLVGIKGNPKGYNTFVDCDVIVSEVRDTSHKPDEIYGIIERFWPNSKKIELFGRQHNTQPNWVTLGNQLDGIRIYDPDIIKRFQKSYPDGYNLNNLEQPKKHIQ